MNYITYLFPNFRLGVAVFLMLFPLSSTAQTNPREHISGFNMTSLTYKHNKNWMAYAELQLRAIEDYSMPNYYEMKGGIGYTVGKHQPFIGIGKYGTYQDRKFYQDELRLWLQYVYSHKIEKLKVDHRLRAEKRMFHYPQTGLNDDTERYRYRLSLTMPLNTSNIEEGTVFANAFEEIFVGPELPHFKRNRLFGGFGYVLNDYISSNIGYMWQREFGRSNIRNLHFLYFGVNFTIDRLKISPPREIPVAD